MQNTSLVSSGAERQGRCLGMWGSYPVIIQSAPYTLVKKKRERNPVCFQLQCVHCLGLRRPVILGFSRVLW